MKKKSNPASALSKKRMALALVSLMKTYPFADITISQITDHAEVSRATFYRNFDTKEEVLTYYIYLITKDFFSFVLKEEEIVLENNLLFLLNLCRQHSGFFLLLKENQLLYLLLKEWTRYLPVLQGRTNGKIKNYSENISKEQLKYLLIFNVGGFFNLVLTWIEEGMVEEPEDMVQALKELGVFSYNHC